MGEWHKRRWGDRREARKAARSKSDWYGDKHKRIQWKQKQKTKLKARAKLDIATIAKSKGTSRSLVHTSRPTAQMKKMTKVHHGEVNLMERS